MPRDTHDGPENDKIDESLTDHKHSCRLSLRHHGMRLFLLFHPVTHLAYELRNVMGRMVHKSHDRMLRNLTERSGQGV